MNKTAQLFFLAGCLLFAGCDDENSTLQIPAVRPFSLTQYLGVWHEAARMPHWFEKNMTQVTAEYTLLPDGSIRVRNQGLRNGKKHSIDGFVRQRTPGAGELEVSFFRPFYGKYRVLALEADYSAALVSTESKTYAWLLVRSPEQAEAARKKYIPMLKQWGFDCSKLICPEMASADKF